MNIRTALTIAMGLFLITGHTVFAQENLVKKDRNSKSYKDLIRKNFELRKELRDLEKSYDNIANERKVLILHVKELQESRDERLDVIQGLKNTIASLRIEMLKDPKLSETVNFLNEKVRQVEKERNQWQAKAAQFDLDKKKLEEEIESKTMDQKLNQLEVAKGQAEERVKQLQNELKNLESDFKSREKVLQVDLAKSKSEMLNLETLFRDVKLSLKESEEALKKAQLGLENKIEIKEGSPLLAKEVKRLEKKYDQRESGIRTSLQDARDKQSTLEKEKKGLRADLQAAQVSIKKYKAELKKAEQSNKKIQQLTTQIESLMVEFDEKEFDFNAALKKEKDQISSLEKELRESAALVESLEKNWKEQITKLKKEKEANQEKSEELFAKNLILEEKIAVLKEKIELGKQESKQMVANFKKEKMDLERQAKSLRKEMLKNAFEQEYFEEEIKNTRIEKAIFEAKVGQMQDRVATTENELKIVKGNLEEITAQNQLKASEVTALQKEKTNLEGKLVGYIEKFIDRQKDSPSSLISPLSDKKDVKDLITKEEINQKKLDMHYNLALVYDKQKMYKEEEREYRKCLRINPNDANVHYNLAILYDDKLHLNEKAVKHYKKFLELNPSGEGTSQVKRWILHAQQDQRFTDIK